MSIFKTRLEKKIDLLSAKLENVKINSYIELMQDTKKLLLKNFLAGISKGIGMAIGFTILGAVLILILEKIVALNIPIIGKFVSDIVQIVEINLNN